MARIKLILKKLTYAFLIAFGIITLATLIFYEDLEKVVTTRVYTYVEELDYGEIKVDTLHLSIFKHFPNIGLTVRQLEFYEEPDEDRHHNTPPIISASELDLAFNSWDFLVNNNLVLNDISSRDGTLNIEVYKNGDTNLDRVFSKKNKRPVKTTTQKTPKASATPANKPPTSKTPREDEEQLGFLLKYIHLKDYHINFTHTYENTSVAISIDDLKGRIKIDEQEISGMIDTDFDLLKTEPLTLLSNQGKTSLQVDLRYLKANNSIDIKTGLLKFSDIELDVSGTYQHNNNRYLDLSFDATSDNLAYLSKVLKEAELNNNKTLIEDGDIDLKGRIEGQLLGNTPNININFGVHNLNLILPNNQGEFKAIGFDGQFKKPSYKDYSKATLNISNLRGTTPGGRLSGDISVSDLENPYLKSSLAFQIELNQIDELIAIKNMGELTGKVAFSSDLEGYLLQLNDSNAIAPASWNLNFSEVGFKYIHTNKYLSNLNGSIRNEGERIYLNDLKFSYDQSDIMLNGTVDNFYNFLFTEAEAFTANLKLNSKQLFTNDIVLTPDSNATIYDRISNLEIEMETDLYKNPNNLDIPHIDARFKALRFDLDSLPGIKNLTGQFYLREDDKGFSIELDNVLGNMQEGNLLVNGKVAFPPDYSGMSINTTYRLNNLPENYVLELIYALTERDLNQSRLKSFDELTTFNGDLEVNLYMDFNPFAIYSSDLSAKSLKYKLPNSNSSYNFKDLSARLDSLYFNDENSNSNGGIRTIQGALNIGAFSSVVFKNTSSSIRFKGVNDSINISLFSYEDPIASKEGSLTMNLAQEPPQFEFEYEIEDLPMAPLLKNYNDNFTIDGDLNAGIALTSQGDSWDSIVSNLNGDIIISSDSLYLSGVDLDAILKRYERSQNFNLADISAFVLAGPLGMAVTKGADFTNLIAADLKPEDSTFVPKALMDWQINKGMLQTRDVAFSTSQNRIAFIGDINVAKDSIPGFAVHVIDKKGCSLMEQKITGSMNNLEMGRIKIAKTLLGSVINLVNAVVGANCEVVYNGSVAAPKEEN